MKKKIDLSQLSGILNLLGKSILFGIVCGVIYLLYTLKVWNLPMGLINLFKDEPVIAGIFSGVILLFIIG